MIQANELRIGNYYDHNGQVRQATPSTIEEVWDAPREWCKPIPLTEEWLVRFGFEKQMAWTYRKHLSGNNYLVYYLGEKGWSVNNKNYSDFNCQYVHQLQNLYHALTGTELTVKPDSHD